jgi:hypothetical protein
MKAANAVDSTWADKITAMLKAKGYRVSGSSVMWPNLNVSNHGPMRMRDYPDYQISFVPASVPEPESIRDTSVEALEEKIRALPDAK